MPRRFQAVWCPLFVLLLAFHCVACAAVQNPVDLEARSDRWARPVQAEGLPNLFQVTPDLYRSAQPTAVGMRSAEDLGIRTVLSLRTSNTDPELAAGTGLRLEHVPITTWAVGDEEMTAALRIINTAPKPLLLHCYHGADRTGLTIAMYRMIFQGWSKEDAKEELVNGGYGFHSIWRNIPKYIARQRNTALSKAVSGSDTDMKATVAAV